MSKLQNGLILLYQSLPLQQLEMKLYNELNFSLKRVTEKKFVQAIE